jgi:hypothetical protein
MHPKDLLMLKPLILFIVTLASLTPTIAQQQTSGGRDWETEILPKLRELLKVPPSAQFKPVSSKSLPNADPLKICVVPIEDQAVRDAVIEWVGKWNKGKGRKYGAIEVVADPAMADVSVFRVTGPSRHSLPNLSGKDQIVAADVALLVRRPPDVEVWEHWVETVLASEYKAPSFDIGQHIEERMKERAKEKGK